MSASRGGRGLVALTGALFSVSTVFPVAASLLHAEALPRFIGFLDVAVAAALVIAAFALVGRAGSSFPTAVVERSFRCYRVAAALFLLLLAIFFLRGDALRWEVLLPGLAWRAWLFVTALPAALALWKED